MGVLIVSCILAAILGFAAQRASICNVKAVAEAITSRTGYMFACIFKSVLWVFVLTVPFLMLMPTAGARLTGWQLSIGTLLGGFVFLLFAIILGVVRSGWRFSRFHVFGKIYALKWTGK